VKKSIDILTKGGYLLFIHPIGWFKPDEKTGTHDLILSHQIIKMRIYKDTTAKVLFSGKGEISIAYYLLEKTLPKHKTKIIDTDNNTEYLMLNKESLLSLKNNSIISKIQLSKVKLFKTSEDYLTTSIKQTLCEKGNNKLVHRITNKGEITFVKSSNIHKHQYIPKIILYGFTYPRYLYDKRGEYGLIGFNQHYFIGDGLDKLDDYFKTKLSALLLSSLKYDQDFIEPKYYPDVRTLPLEKITDETLADYFGFTKEERETINSTEYPMREYIFKEITCAELKGKKAESDDYDAEGGGKQRRFTRKVRRV
jgi:hypothetical protein